MQLRAWAEGREESAAADEGEPAAGAERETEADCPVSNRADAQVGHNLGDHSADVLHSAETDLEHREAGLHEHHETAGDDHPDRVGRDAGRLGGGGVVRRDCDGYERTQEREPRRDHEHRFALLERRPEVRAGHRQVSHLRVFSHWPVVRLGATRSRLQRVLVTKTAPLARAVRTTERRLWISLVVSSTRKTWLSIRSPLP